MLIAFVKFVPTTRADFESASEYAEHLDYVQRLRSKYHKQRAVDCAAWHSMGGKELGI